MGGTTYLIVINRAPQPALWTLTWVTAPECPGVRLPCWPWPCS